jgi:hypothetical protein
MEDRFHLGKPILTNTPPLGAPPGARDRKPVSTEELLTERGKTHGDYGDHATITQALKHTINAWDKPLKSGFKLNVVQRESLDMIAHKIGRILAGDPDFRDHWDDIAGYAKLAADRCSK